jgi:hypothetical protein
MTNDVKIEFDLLRNAIDSIERAIEVIAYFDDEKDDAKRLKQAVLSAAHGIELLLKERLRRVHPAMIWDDVDKYPSPNARTVNVETAINRLIKIAGVQIDESDYKLLRELRDTRNAIEHYAWSTTKLQADTTVGEALGFAVHFAKDELAFEFSSYGDHRGDALSQLMSNNPQFSEAYIKRQMKRAGKPAEPTPWDDDLPF